MDLKNLSGSVKVAILLQAVQPGVKQQLLQGLPSEQIEEVNAHLAQMGPVPPELIETVAREFAETIKSGPSRSPKPGVSKKAAEPDEEIPEGAVSKSAMRAVLNLASDQLFELIKDEHPQTIAIVLVHLKTAVASDVLSRMPDELKTDIAIRIANLDKVMSGMVDEINQVFEEILKNKDTSVTKFSGGVDRLAEILNQTDEFSSELVLNEIEENDEELAAKIKQKMFVFEDLILVDDRGFQKLLRRVETAELAAALKAASEEVKEKVFRNMSARAGEMLKEEMEDLGPVRMKEVSDAQQKITALIQEMEAKNEVIISGRRGEELVA